MVLPSVLTGAGRAVAVAPGRQNAEAGTHTPAAPQQVFTAHAPPSGHSALVAQGSRPAQPVCPSRHTPPWSGVVAHTGCMQPLSGLQGIKVEHVAPSHSGLTSGVHMQPLQKKSAAQSASVSHSSGGVTTPSPQKPSTVQVGEQPSPALVLPSSHSSPGQSTPSPQGLTASYTQPVAGLQESDVQALPSSQVIGEYTQPLAGSQESDVQALPSSTTQSP